MPGFGAPAGCGYRGELPKQITRGCLDPDAD